MIFRVLYGSHAHGTATHTSDEDWRGVFQLPSETFLGLEAPKTTHEDKPDQVFWELGHFCRLLLKGNPNIVGMLFAPDDVIETVHPAFLPLLDERHRFLHEGTMRAYMGWVWRELRDLQKLPPEAFRFKRLSHVPRLLYEIQSIIKSGGTDMLVRPEVPELNFIMAVKCGDIPWSEAMFRSTNLARMISDEVDSFEWAKPPREWLQTYLLDTREAYG